MATQPPQDPNQPVYQQAPGGQPPQKSNPWPWVMGAVAIIVAGVIAALVITGGPSDSPTVSTTQTIPPIPTPPITPTPAPPPPIPTPPPPPPLPTP